MGSPVGATRAIRTIEADALVIGAGLVGSAVTMGLAQRGVTRTLCVDLDLSGEWSSSELNAGGVRATWSQKVNLLTSKLSIEYFQKHAKEVGYHPCGYLWLHRPVTFDAALRAREMHVASGWDVEAWDVNAIRTRTPFIDKTSDLAGALFGVKDGLVNPNRLKEHFREQAMIKRARFMDNVWVLSARSGEHGRTIVRAFQFHAQVPSAEKKRMLSVGVRTEADFDLNLGTFIEIEVEQVVNAAGAWAPQVAEMLGYTCPSQPVRRQISMFHARDLDLTKYGMIIDPSGVYFHPESIYGLSGYATPNEPAGANFTYDGEDFFQEHIWANLYERSTAFESLKHVSGWAGLYEMSPDHHAIIGRVENSKLASSAIFEAHSFSGHGAMQSYGVGVALAELMTSGKYETLDLSELSASRFTSGRKISEELWVI